jgi:hypothetical protein
MGVWQGVAMESPRFHLGLPCPTLLRLACRQPLKRPYGCFRGSQPEGGQPAAVFYPLGQSTPHAL